MQLYAHKCIEEVVGADILTRVSQKFCYWQSGSGLQILAPLVDCGNWPQSKPSRLKNLTARKLSGNQCHTSNLILTRTRGAYSHTLTYHAYEHTCCMYICVHTRLYIHLESRRTCTRICWHRCTYTYTAAWSIDINRCMHANIFL